MDDVLTVVAHDEAVWSAGDFVRDFESSSCYMPPLKLERTEPEYFLETRLELTADGRFTHRLKNTNEGRECDPKVWRYHRWDSFGSESMKCGVLVGCLDKVERMASDSASFWMSLRSKLREFEALGYPAEVLRGTARRMYARGGSERWLEARHLLPTH
jgi:hypothetical protein